MSETINKLQSDNARLKAMLQSCTESVSKEKRDEITVLLNGMGLLDKLKSDIAVERAALEHNRRRVKELEDAIVDQQLIIEDRKSTIRRLKKEVETYNG